MTNNFVLKSYRITINHPKMVRFHIGTSHQHEKDEPDNLKIALIHKAEKSSNEPRPKILDIEMDNYLDYKPETTIHIKVCLFYQTRPSVS